MAALLDLATETRQAIWGHLVPDNLDDLASVCRVSRKLYEEASYVLYHGRKVYFTINPRNRYRHIQVRGLGRSRSFLKLGRYNVPWHRLSAIRINIWGIFLNEYNREVTCVFAQLFSIRHMARSIVYLLQQAQQLPDLEFRFLESPERSWWLWFDHDIPIVPRSSSQSKSPNARGRVNDLDATLCLFRTLRGARSVRIWIQRPHKFSGLAEPEFGIFSRFIEDSGELSGEFNWPEPFSKQLTRNAVGSSDFGTNYANFVAAKEHNTALEINLMFVLMIGKSYYADQDLELEKIMHSSVFLRKFEHMINCCVSLAADDLKVCRDWIFSHRCEQKFYVDHYNWPRISAHLKRNLKATMPRDWMVGRNFMAKYSSAGFHLTFKAVEGALSRISDYSPETIVQLMSQLPQRPVSTEAFEIEWPGNSDRTAFMTYWCVT